LANVLELKKIFVSKEVWRNKSSNHSIEVNIIDAQCGLVKYSGTKLTEGRGST